MNYGKTMLAPSGFETHDWPPIFGTLSTGEIGEFEGKNVAFDPNPRGSDCSQNDGFLKRRERRAQVPAKCLGYASREIVRQSTRTGLGIGVGGRWLPKSYADTKCQMENPGREGLCVVLTGRGNSGDASRNQVARLIGSSARHPQIPYWPTVTYTPGCDDAPFKLTSNGWSPAAKVGTVTFNS